MKEIDFSKFFGSYILFIPTSTRPTFVPVTLLRMLSRWERDPSTRDSKKTPSYRFCVEGLVGQSGSCVHSKAHVVSM